jgi:trk system potassium uptake protein TrkA
VIEAGDEVFCLAATKDIRKVMRELRRMDKPVKRIMIAGGGNIGHRLVRAIEGELPGQGDRPQQAPRRVAGREL